MAECDVYIGNIMDEEVSSNEPLPGRQEPQGTIEATVIEVDFAYERKRREADRSSVGAGAEMRAQHKLRDPRRAGIHPHRQEPSLLPGRAPTENRRKASSMSTLSPGEADTLRLLMAGAQTQEVASQLGLNEVAVKDHVKSILRKLQAKRSACSSEC
jgi:DNA-binding CsgD family transcriptional regulator